MFLKRRGYLPCNYQAPVTGIYSIAIFGPLGQNSSSIGGGPTAEIAMTSPNNFNGQQNSTVAAWDVTVRADATSTTDLNGRLFTYALAAFTGGNTNAVCTGSFGDTKALDLWTYFPCSQVQTSLNIVSAAADLSVAKTASSGTPNVGSDVTFNVTVSNAGPDAATNVRVSDQLPAGLTFVSAIPSQGSYTSGTGIWDVGTLASGASATLQVVARVTGVGLYTNVAQVGTSDQFDPDSIPNNNNAAEDDQASATVSGQEADLSLATTMYYAYLPIIR